MCDGYRQGHHTLGVVAFYWLYFKRARWPANGLWVSAPRAAWTHSDAAERGRCRGPGYSNVSGAAHIATAHVSRTRPRTGGQWRWRRWSRRRDASRGTLVASQQLGLAGGEGARPDCLHERGWEEKANILQCLWGGACCNRSRTAQAAHGQQMAVAAVEPTRPMALW